MTAGCYNVMLRRATVTLCNKGRAKLDLSSPILRKLLNVYIKHTLYGIFMLNHFKFNVTSKVAL